MGIGIDMSVAEIKIAAIKIVPEDSTKTLSKKSIQRTALEYERCTTKREAAAQ
jgi:hypothetical protein